MVGEFIDLFAVFEDPFFAGEIAKITFIGIDVCESVFGGKFEWAKETTFRIKGAEAFF